MSRLRSIRRAITTDQEMHQFRGHLFASISEKKRVSFSHPRSTNCYLVFSHSHENTYALIWEEFFQKNVMLLQTKVYVFDNISYHVLSFFESYVM